MTFNIGLHEVCVRVGVRYVITKFSRMDSLPNFLTHGAPLRARELRYNQNVTLRMAFLNLSSDLSSLSDLSRLSHSFEAKFVEVQRSQFLLF